MFTEIYRLNLQI